MKYTLKAIKQGKEINTGAPLTKTLLMKATAGKDLQIFIDGKLVFFPQEAHERIFLYSLEDKNKKLTLRVNIKNALSGLNVTFSALNEQYKYLKEWRQGPTPRFFSYAEDSKHIVMSDNIWGTVKTVSISDKPDLTERPLYLYHQKKFSEKEIVFKSFPQKKNAVSIQTKQISSSSVLELKGEKYYQDPVIQFMTKLSPEEKLVDGKSSSINQIISSFHCIKLFSAPSPSIFIATSDAYELIVKHNKLHVVDKLLQKLPVNFQVPFFLESNKKEHKHGVTIQSFNSYSLKFKANLDKKNRILKLTCQDIALHMNGKIETIKIEPISLDFNYIIINR